MARVKKMYHVITFHTTTEAMGFEKACLEKKIPGRMIPVPREISAGCGLAFRVLSEDYIQYEAAIENLGLAHQAITKLMI